MGGSGLERNLVERTTLGRARECVYVSVPYYFAPVRAPGRAHGRVTKDSREVITQHSVFTHGAKRLTARGSGNRMSMSMSKYGTTSVQ